MEMRDCNGCEVRSDEFSRNYLGKWIGLDSSQMDYPSCCDGCSNNPKNGGSGICNCTLPYMQNPISYTATTETSCMANNINGYIYCVDSVDDLKKHKANTTRIKEAKSNISKYIKE